MEEDNIPKKLRYDLQLTVKKEVLHIDAAIEIQSPDGVSIDCRFADGHLLSMYGIYDHETKQYNWIPEDSTNRPELSIAIGTLIETTMVYNFNHPFKP